ncbi:tetratricopeptide repeat protein [Porphyrobacter sp. GA68]|uniref:tetratricopeptide repeat protein n=1 Tax=Porphyrobacter sp. GA68 TaxID=2883480 RepID=UPI001D17DEF4|nr:tetratricopeptide repeat protein [Porphyrobacter sp. GA68]
MTPSTVLILAAVQVGPALPGDPNAVPTLPSQPPRTAAPAAPGRGDAPATGAEISSRLERCLSVIATNPAEALSAASSWQAETGGAARAQAGHCAGLALVQLGRFAEAKAAFAAAQNDAVGEDPAYAARLGGLAGNAALLGGDGAEAVTPLDAARTEALKAGEQELALGLQLDAAAARAQLGQLTEAQASMSAAREVWPQNAEVWLLSAMLSRGVGDLAGAQALIERAAQLAPRAPQVALEAGIIAALDGRIDAARQSWQSVLTVAPGTPMARTAQSYLAQLDGAAAPAPEPASR